MLRGLSRRLIRRLARLLPAPQLRDGRDGDLRHYADVTVGRVLFWTVILLFALTISILVAVDQAGLSVGFLTDVLLLVLGGGLLGAAITFGLGARATVANILASTQLQRIYKVGHRVRIGDVQGEIVETTATAVLLESDEGRVSVPASIFERNVSIRLLERT